MEQEIIELLQMPKSEESLNNLCRLTNILPFQTEKFIESLQSFIKQYNEYINR